MSEDAWLTLFERVNMKLTDELKKVKNKNKRDVAKSSINKAEEMLTDDKLDKVSGGGIPPLEQIRKGDPGENGQ